MDNQRTLYTLAEAAELTGLSIEALRLRVKRGKLASQQGNDGRPRVVLTTADLEDFRRPVDRRKPTLIEQKPTLNRQEALRANIVVVLEAAVGALRERVERSETQTAAERARADAAQVEAAELRERLGRAEGEAEGLKLGLEHLQDLAAQAKQEAEEARQKAEEAARRAEDAERQVREAEAALARLRDRGLLARLLNRDSRP